MPLANVFAPMGFLCLEPDAVIAKHRTRPCPGNRVPIGAAASADLAIGDAYGLDVNGNAYHAGPDAVVRGVVVGFELQAIPGVMNGNGPISIDYGYATYTSAISLICAEDPDEEFQVWTDNVTGATQANIGGVFNLGDAAPDSLFAQSRQYLNVNGGPGTQFKLTEILQSPADNSPGAACRVKAKLNQAM